MRRQPGQCCNLFEIILPGSNHRMTHKYPLYVGNEAVELIADAIAREAEECAKLAVPILTSVLRNHGSGSSKLRLPP